MAEIRIRNVEEWVVEFFCRRAHARGQTLEAEIRELLRQEARRSKRQLAAELKHMLKRLRQKYGQFSDSAILIREDRDARG